MNVGIWLSFLGESIALGIALYAATALVIGWSIASFGLMPIWVGIVLAIIVPLLGPLVLLVIAIVRHSKDRRSRQIAILSDSETESARTRGRPRVLSRRGATSITALGIVIVAATSTLFLQWFAFKIIFVPDFVIGAFGSGLNFGVIPTVGLAIIALILASFRPSRWSAILMVLVGSAWVSFGGIGVLLMIPLQATAAGINSTSAIVGWLGPLAGVVMSGLPASSSQAVTEAVAHVGTGHIVSISAGPALYIVLVVGTTMVIWSIFEIAIAHRHAVQKRTSA